MIRALLVASGTLALAACAAPQSTPLSCPECPPPVECPACPDARPLVEAGLNGVAWTQTAVEFDAVVLQAWQLALLHVDAAVADPSWSAMIEQQGEGANLPPAVVLDLDETVLDNSPYQAWSIQSGEGYSRDTWNAWCEAREAGAMPGAIPFLQELADRGVAIFYLSNRYAETEEATRDNLIALGAPLSDEYDAVLLRGEYDDGTSEKGIRREVIAETHRVIMLFGDNLGDFVEGYKTDLAGRQALADAHAAWWGTRWFALPNPQYGSWEGALFDFDYSQSALERHEAKIDALDAWTPAD